MMKDGSGKRYGLDHRCGRRLSLHFMSPAITTGAPQGQFGCGTQACRVRTEVATGVHLPVVAVIHAIGNSCRLTQCCVQARRGELCIFWCQGSSANVANATYAVVRASILAVKWVIHEVGPGAQL